MERFNFKQPCHPLPGKILRLLPLTASIRKDDREIKILLLLAVISLYSFIKAGKWA